MSKELPSPELLRKLLRYDPETGKLFWRERTPDMFSDSYRGQKGNCNNWNSIFAGKEAFTAVHNKAYFHGSILHKAYLAHRVIWAMEYQEWPKTNIDHINGDGKDNRIVNLRLATQAENTKNSCRPRHNTSGISGVGWHSQTQKWRAFIQVSGKFIHLGLFQELKDAAFARKLAEKKYGFHSNHGRQAK
jgi:hypothetical protein